MGREVLRQLANCSNRAATNYVVSPHCTSVNTMYECEHRPLVRAKIRYSASTQFTIECELDHMCVPMLRVVYQIVVSLPDAKVRCGFLGVKSSEHLSIHGRTGHEVRSTAFYLHSRRTRNDCSSRFGQRMRAPLRQLLLRIIGGGFQCAHWLSGGH